MCILPEVDAVANDNLSYTLDHSGPVTTVSMHTTSEHENLKKRMKPWLSPWLAAMFSTGALGTA